MTYFLLVLATFFTFSFKAIAETSAPLSVKKVKSEAPLLPGSNGLIKILLSLKPDHKAYIDQFQLSSDLSAIKNTPLRVFPSKTFNDTHTGKLREVVTGEFTLETVIEWPEEMPRKPASVDLNLKYQACTMKYCYTPKTLKITLPQS